MAEITEILDTDYLTDSVDTINNNFNALNDGKEEAGTCLPLSGGVMTQDIYFSSDTTKGTPPSSTVYRGGLWSADGQGHDVANRYGGMETVINTDGSVQQRLIAYKNVAGSTGSTSIGITAYADGTSATNAPTPATADNSTKIATTAYVKNNLNSYLPLSGGEMTNSITLNAGILAKKINDNGQLQINGATTYANGAYLILNGKDYSSRPGGVTICANDGNSNSQLRLNASGSATWGENELDTIVSSGTNYIRYANGIQICWFFSTNFAVASSGETQITYPQAFVGNPAVSMVGGFGTDWASGKSYSNTGFLAVMYNQSGTKYTSGSRTFGYIAVGRWK